MPNPKKIDGTTDDTLNQTDKGPGVPIPPEETELPNEGPQTTTGKIPRELAPIDGDDTMAFDPEQINDQANEVLVQTGNKATERAAKAVLRRATAGEVGAPSRPKDKKSKFRKTYGRSEAAANRPDLPEKHVEPPPTPDQLPKTPARQKLEDIAQLHRDGDIFPNQSLLRKWPELFPRNLSRTATLRSQGLSVVSVHTSSPTNFPEIAQALFKDVNHAIIANISPNFMGGGGYFLDILVDEESCEKTMQVVQQSGYSNSVNHGGTDAELSFTQTGINIIGQDIENLHRKTLGKDAEQDMDTKNPHRELLHQSDFLRKRNIREGAEKPKVYREKERFLAHIRLEDHLGSELRSIQQTISTTASNKYGCKAVFSNRDIIIFSESERPTAIGRAIRDEIRLYLERVYGDGFSMKTIRGEIGLQYHTQDESNTKHFGAPSNKYPIAIPPSLEGNFTENLAAIPTIPGVITTDASMEPFTNSTRYFDLGLQLGVNDHNGQKVTTIEKEKAKLILLERGFVGRENETAKLKDLLGQTVNGGKIIEVKGVAGVGKTELLLHSIPKDTIIIRPGEGKTGTVGTEIMDFSTNILQYVEKNNITGNIGFTRGVEYLNKLIKNPHEYSEDEFVARILAILMAISLKKQGENDFFGLMIDDIDDIKPPAFGAIFRLLGEIKGKPEKYKNILITLSRRSDINYSEDMTDETEHIGRQLQMKQISARLVDEDGKIYIEPLKLGSEKDGTPEYAEWLEEFIIGKVMQRTDNGKHVNKINETRVRNTTFIGNLIAQMAGRKQADGTIKAVPHYMVQAINELMFHGYLKYDSETNEIYLIKYNEAKKLMPKEPEGLHAIQFERLDPYEQKAICSLYILEGIDTSTVDLLKSKFPYLGILDDLKGGREILEKSDKIALVRQWRTFLEGHLKQNPEIFDELKSELTSAILQEIDKKGINQTNIDPIVLFKLTEEYVFDQNSKDLQEIISQNSLKAADQAMNNYKSNMALKCAEHFLAQPNTIDPDKFLGHIIALRACIAINDEEKALTHLLNVGVLADTDEKKAIIAQIALQGAYHQYKHCQLKQDKAEKANGKTAIQKALENYDNRIEAVTNKLEIGEEGYQKALLLHHIASILVERIAAGSYDHEQHKELYKVEGEKEPTKDKLYNHALKLAQEAQNQLGKLDQTNLNQWEKELMVANLNLQCVLHLEMVRSWYGSDNTQIITASEHGETKVIENLKKGGNFANQSLRMASKHGIFAPETKARSALNRLMAAMYQGKTEGVKELVEAAIAQIGFAHESTTKSMLIHIAVTALDLCRAKPNLPKDLEQHLLEKNHDINADLYAQDPNYVMNIYNYAETWIFRSMRSSEKIAKQDLKKSIKILTTGEPQYKDTGYFPYFIILLSQHAFAAANMGTHEFAKDYRSILTPQDVISILTKTKAALSSNGSGDNETIMGLEALLEAISPQPPKL